MSAQREQILYPGVCDGGDDIQPDDGQSSTGFAAGYNSVNFVLSSGTASIAGASTWFGWADVDALGNRNTAMIATSYPSGGGPVSYYHAPVAGLVIGQALSDFHAFSDPGTNQNDHAYLLQVTTVPEGAESLGLVLMAGGLFFVAARRKSMVRLQ